MLVLGLMLSYGVYADEIEVPMDPIPESQFGQGNRSLTQLPTVTYEDNEVFINAPYYIGSMDVVIYDATGVAIFTYNAAMVAGRNTIILPQAVSDEKYSIVLSYGDVCLLGYF